MNKVEFVDFSFEDVGEFIRAWFYRNYYFDILKTDLEEISLFKVEEGSIYFSAPFKVVEKKLGIILSKGIRHLKNRLRGKDTIFIDSNLNIPLIGSNEFGLIDRGTNIIEVKPVTGCNLACIFCSISEGPNNKRDLLLDLDYLLDEFAALASIKKLPVEANIGPQGEPLLYPKIVELVRGLKDISNVEVVSINTNGLLLSEALIDELFGAGLTRINLSLHTLDGTRASKLAGGHYDVERIIKLIKYCEGKIDVMLTPLFIPDYNDDLDDLFLFASSIKNLSSPVLGVQNYLNYKQGRNLVEQKDWDFFYDFLKRKEVELNVPLMLKESDFKIDYDVTLPKPFKKGQLVKAEIVCPGRGGNEVLAKAEGRVITIINPKKISGGVSVKILRDKHNIFLAT
ncbi:MAG: radical SAM protein [Candidatus Woesearchaeota archaeon]